ncbi:MAG TPA: metal-dependent transcriptional regulator [Thermoleophilaceae bacterium]|nr:metal-dependent transcriptional regulator [Thermoleophilaceae bacterium]
MVATQESTGREPAHHAHRARSRGAAVENYAKAIYVLEARGERPVATNPLAGRLGVTPASASAMLKRLARDGLVEHVPYHGVRLTPEGRKLALRLIRNHRLLELYLAEELGVPWDRVHREAEVLEHVLSDELAERMAAKLGQPDRDPHGDPIPTRDGELEESRTVGLADLEPGDHGVLARISDSRPDMLRYLAERGIAPGQEVEVLAREPFGGPLTVRLAGREHALGGELARSMRVAEHR